VLADIRSGSLQLECATEEVLASGDLLFLNRGLGLIEKFHCFEMKV
jgi:hypothetical protein